MRPCDRARAGVLGATPTGTIDAGNTPAAGVIRVPTRAAGPTRLGLVTCMLLALLLTAGVERKAATLNRDATEAYTAEQYDEAAKLYSEALTQSPESPAISYNLGNALHRNQRLEDAASALARASQTEDPVLRHRALHNLGNTMFRMGSLPEALDAYRRALDTNPHDLDTKINFEKALSLMQEQEQQQEQQQQEQENQDEPQDGEQGQEGESGEQDDQQQQEQQQGEQEENEQQQQPSDEGSQESESSGSEEEQPPEEPQSSAEQVAEGELRYEEALRILEAMRDQEKERQKERAQKMRARAARAGKDW